MKQFILVLLSVFFTQAPYSHADVTVISRLNGSLPYTFSLNERGSGQTTAVTGCSEANINLCDGYHKLKTNREGNVYISYPVYRRNETGFTINDQVLEDGHTYEFKFVGDVVKLKSISEQRLLPNYSRGLTGSSP